METLKPRSATNNSKSKLVKTFQKVINLRNPTKISSNNGIGICMLTSQNKFDDDDTASFKSKTHHHYSDKHGGGDPRIRHRAVMEALVAKLFAGITSIKASYAELQVAQNPYNSDAIHVADQAVVDELKAISELKRSFLKKELDLSPQVTIMLAEIQEQQSMMKTYEITIKKLECEIETKESKVSLMKTQLQESITYNKSLEKRLNASGPISTILENVQLSSLKPSHLVQFLHYTLRSIRGFVKLMIREMESAQWDLESAARVIEPGVIFTKTSHRYFVFESFVCKTMFEGFNFPNFSPPSVSQSFNRVSRDQYFNGFTKLKSVNVKHILAQKPNSSFANFLRSKYLQLVHAKMECSLFGNLNQRKLINAGGFPDSAFFTSFAEMARRVWLLHCLAYSFDQEVSIFQVPKNCRFSEVYMENVSDDSVFSSEIVDSSVDFRVNFTVVPGFKIGTSTVIQCQVYLSPMITPATR
ncbi:hypothetical protein LWI29_030827 [Acer saccharum]|uniref:DUF641 domain-containing protein n=1 Tax=Acer saccharum TaxID=4024 RepID=A0AA39VH79_ACESA|nr:hypothetical protein LWI29_030827 [Acer saccharum]KAK1556880.1 hypothetical protein Q3G72_013865 [Acer saccharum]